jgi:hypothetical protein
MTKTEIRRRMLAIRRELDEMAVRRADLIWDYRELNAALGRIEKSELDKEVRK